MTFTLDDTIFDWQNPDYAPEYARRLKNYQNLKAHPEQLPLIMGFYKENPVNFIEDWGVTFDPRGNGGFMPFLLFPKQKELVTWLVDHWRTETSGLVEKSRDMGLSWVTLAVSCWICIFHEAKVVGFGSAKEADVDVNGDVGSLFEKARMFMDHLPEEFRAGYSRSTTKHMLLRFPKSQSFIYGGSGDNLGRGTRASMFVIDESAFLEHPQKALASLSGTTNCRIDVSTPNGQGNPFYVRRFSGEVDVFSYHWRQDPRRDEQWYKEKCKQIGDRATIAREFDINYSDSMDFAVIESQWIEACVDSAQKLGIANSGHRIAALDVADQGMDKNALAMGYGFELQHLELFSGKGSDIAQTTAWAFHFCDRHECTTLRYDADGLGAGVRGDARVINATRINPLQVVAFQGSGKVVHPERREHGRPQKNKDYLANFKAQAWWHLRYRMEKTFRAVEEGADIDHEDLISISSSLTQLPKLRAELCQPTYRVNQLGKIVIEKTPEGNQSPNMADAVMMFYAPIRAPLIITDADIEQVSHAPSWMHNEVFRQYS